MKLRCALLGKVLGHSFSKLIHSYFADYSYDLLEVSEEECARIIKSAEYDGLNVTIPYKELAFSICDEVDEVARNTKSVNTIVYRDGKICGYNTDVFGFTEMVKSAGIDFSGKNVLVLGSGGTSKTAVYSAKMMSAKSVTVVSRNGEVNYNNVYSMTDTGIIVNTTPVGMYPNCDATPLDISRFSSLSGVVDVIYNPKKTELLRHAELLSVPRCNGLYMLSAQGLRAAEIFLGKSLSPALAKNAERGVLSLTENIVLIGMPGCGKSTVGRLVAEKLGREFVDTDEVIRERFGAPSDIITKHGEAEFRAIEKEICREFGKKSGLVLATGGGVVETEENYTFLARNGRIFCITRNIAELETQDRPLSKDLGALWMRRRDKYKAFADVFIENDSSPEDTAERIIKTEL